MLAVSAAAPQTQSWPSWRTRWPLPLLRSSSPSYRYQSVLLLSLSQSCSYITSLSSPIYPLNSSLLLYCIAFPVFKVSNIEARISALKTAGLNVTVCNRFSKFKPKPKVTHSWWFRAWLNKGCHTFFHL